MRWLATLALLLTGCALPPESGPGHAVLAPFCLIGCHVTIIYGFQPQPRGHDEGW